MDRITFICVNFNNASYTEALCESLLAQDGLEAEFSVGCVVVDNSTDSGDVERLEKYCAQQEFVSLVRTGQNEGYFGALNVGLTKIGDKDSRFVVICNNDLKFDRRFCAELLRADVESDVFALCPDVRTEDGFHQNPHISIPISGLRRFQFDLYFLHYYVACILTALRRSLFRRNRRNLGVLPRMEIHMGIGACYVLTPKFFLHYTQLKYPCFLYGEEAFFSAQIHSAGGRLVFEPRLKVEHAESASLSKVPRRSAYEYAREGYPLYRDYL